METLFVDVVIPFSLPQLFTYRVPRSMNNQVQERVRVVVQFGKSKMYSALVAKVHTSAPQNYEAKYIESVLDSEPIVLDFQLKFWQWIAQYYMCSLGEVMNTALPSGFKLNSETILHIHPAFDGDFRALNDKEYVVAEALQNHDKLTLAEVGDILGQKTIVPLIKSLVEKRVAISAEDLKLRFKPKMVEYVRFTPQYREEENLRELFDTLSRAPKQLELLMQYVKLSAWHSQQPKELKKVSFYKEAGGSLSQVKALVDKDVFEIYSKEEGRVSVFNTDQISDPELSEEQQATVESMNQQFKEKPVVLLHGVTSSGKTEVYINLAKQEIADGKKVLFLVPEIALTTQLVNRLKVRFGNRLGVYHSKFNENERVEIWNNALLDKYDVVIGARSTLFVPLQNIGLIIVDEEHETSYKQYDPQPRYHARDAAVVLGNQIGAKVILGSATPSMETFYNAQKELYGKAEMLKRFSDVKLPEIFVADVKEAYKNQVMKANISPDLFDAIMEALRLKKQVILFQNRRGFSPVMRCENCGWTPECRACDISLTYHKYRNQLSCHYCAYATPVPNRCGRCGSAKMRLAGFGTEKVEEDLELFFPDAKIVRMDLDTTRNKNSYSRILSQFEDREIDILVGTQMISKGLDFDHVSLVGILSADNMLAYPDFRAYERSYQLMTQVAGRAGRKGKRGKVIIQSFEPEHLIIRKVVEGDYLGMIKDQLVHRKQFNYPPFSRIIRITLKHRDQNTVRIGSQALAKQLRALLSNRVLGPETPSISRIRNLYLENIVIKLPKSRSNNQLKSKLNEVFEKFSNQKAYRSIRLSIDVDPV